MRTKLHVVEEDRLNCLERQKTDKKTNKKKNGNEIRISCTALTTFGQVTERSLSCQSGAAFNCYY